MMQPITFNLWQSGFSMIKQMVVFTSSRLPVLNGFHCFRKRMLTTLFTNGLITCTRAIFTQLAMSSCPNHVHVLLYFRQMPKSLNTIIGNTKRFIAYEIIKRLEEAKEEKLVALLQSGVKESERKKGQIHKVFEDSFDAKQCYSKDLMLQKLAYIHHNPVNKNG